MTGPDLLPIELTEPSAVRRLMSRRFGEWARQARSTGYCSRPIRLAGRSTSVDTSTGVQTSRLRTSDLPDGVLYVRCGNRRGSVCPSCSHEYQGDMWHLLSAGVSGGDKSVPESVSEHPLVFLTLTAPSFGTVHTSSRPDGPKNQCSTRSAPRSCEHGRSRRCGQVHDAEDEIVGQPLCPDCYDYDGQVVWQWHCPELWRRFTIKLRRKIASGLGLSERACRDVLRVQYAKVGEYQKRGAIHLHALVRLDGAPTADSSFPSPLAGVSSAWLADRCQEAAEDVEVIAPAVDAHDCERVLRFGSQIDVRPVTRGTGNGEAISPAMVAAYLAKYATKAAGDVATNGRANVHLRRLRHTCEVLCVRAISTHGSSSTYALLSKWAEALGFRGHFSSKSRRFSTTLSELREARRRFQRSCHQRSSEPEHLNADETADEDLTVVVNEFQFAGQGWLTPGDAELARSAADAAREWRTAQSENDETGKEDG